MRAIARSQRAFAFLFYGLISWARSAEAALPDCNVSGAPFSVDSDADGIADGCDPCPALADDETEPGRDPSCYLSLGWLPPEYRRDAKGHEGRWWTAGDCTPSLAFPIHDRGSSSDPADGLVIVGRAGRTARAACLISVDYRQQGTQLVVHALRAPALAAAYAGWVDTSAGSPSYSPPDGLGLLTSYPVEKLEVRGPELTLPGASLERLAFSRGVVYGEHLDATSSTSCNAIEAASQDDPDYDPTQEPREASHTICVDKGGSAVSATMPVDWRIVPTVLDHLLLEERERLRYGLGDAPLDVKSQADTMEELPYGLRIDDRGVGLGSRRTAHFDSTSGAAFDFDSRAAKPWVVVPDAIGMLRQTTHLLPEAGTGLFVAALYPPAGDAEFHHLAGKDRMLVFQRFTVDLEHVLDLSATAVRGVEAIWPEWPPIAATSESNGLYGDRWTVSAGVKDCWVATPDEVTALSPNQQFAYPEVVSADETLATDFCPSVLTDLRANPAYASVWSQDAARAQCERGAIGQDEAMSVTNLVTIVQGCSFKGFGTSGNAACCAPSGCTAIDEQVVCEPNICCHDLQVELSKLVDPDKVTHNLACIANHFMESLATQFPECQHWKDVGRSDDGLDCNPQDKQRVFLPMVAMVRAEGHEPSLESFMTTNDFFVGGAHQGLDWNWDIEDDVSVDPAYRAIARRNGQFIGIENELEFLIPMGRWTEGWFDTRTDPTQNYETHRTTVVNGVRVPDDSLPDFLKGLADVHGLAELGQIWPTTPPFLRLFGFNREPGSQTQHSFPNGVDQLAPFWRHHFGRGLFMPLTGATMDSHAYSGLMAGNPKWPAEKDDKTSGTVGNPVPLGVDNWNEQPHRLTFLGRAILDCGHDPFRVEIHPPHFLSMDVANAEYNGAQGRTVAAFGWMNGTVPSQQEFDLWPPARPSARAELVVGGLKNVGPTGADCSRAPSFPAAGAHGPSDWGWVIDDCTPQHRPEMGPATLKCDPAPTVSPNHVHCVYEDPSATQPPLRTSDRYKNPRMTPFYATSRFDLRVFLGWSEP